MIIGIFTHFFAVETTLAERQFFRALAMLIGKRAARLSACGIAAIVSKMGYLEEGCSVGADGSLYNVRLSLFFYLGAVDGLTDKDDLQKYPGFADRIHEGLIDIFGEKGKNIVTHHAEDGSGVGSAIIAGTFSSHLSSFPYAMRLTELLCSDDEGEEGRWAVHACLDYASNGTKFAVEKNVYVCLYDCTISRRLV